VAVTFQKETPQRWDNRRDELGRVFSAVILPLAVLDSGFSLQAGFASATMVLDLIYWQENEGRRMALNGNILLPSFFCQ
jgi:hypothetical protein